MNHQFIIPYDLFLQQNTLLNCVIYHHIRVSIILALHIFSNHDIKLKRFSHVTSDQEKKEWKIHFQKLRCWKYHLSKKNECGFWEGRDTKETGKRFNYDFYRLKNHQTKDEDDFMWKNLENYEPILMSLRFNVRIFFGCLQRASQEGSFGKLIYVLFFV